MKSCALTRGYTMHVLGTTADMMMAANACLLLSAAFVGFLDTQHTNAAAECCDKRRMLSIMSCITPDTAAASGASAGLDLLQCIQ